MTTTATTDRHRYLLAMLGPKVLADMAGALSVVETATIDRFLTRQGLSGLSADELAAVFDEQDRPLGYLAGRALDVDGSVSHPEAFAILTDTARCDAYLELVAR